MVTRINLITSIDISCHKKLIAAHPNKVSISLMCRSERTKHGHAIDVIVVIFAPCDVIFSYQYYAIEILLCDDYWAGIIKVSIIIVL